MKNSKTGSKKSLFLTLNRVAIKRANRIRTGEPPIKMPKHLTSDSPVSITRQPWLPKELRPFRKARALLGVLIDPPRLGLENYHHRHDEKMLRLISNAENPTDLILDVTSRSDLIEMMPDQNPPSILEWMKLDQTLMPGRTGMLLFLRKQLPMSQVIEELELDGEETDPVSDKTFLEEIRNATLKDYLELAIPM
jgi:hypothetical protein